MLFISLQELSTVAILEVAYISEDCVKQESFESIVVSVFESMLAKVSQKVVRPVSILNTVQNSVVLCDGKSLLKGFQVS